MKKLLIGLMILGVALKAISCPISSVDLSLKMKQVGAQKSKSSFSVLDNNLTEEEFDNVVNRIRDHYTPIFKELGKTLNVYSSWTFPMNNAFATVDKNGSNVYFFGLFTMNKYMTKDSFLFVGCHEIGHHIGGFPKMPKTPWCSTEGQSDYFAASKCYRDLLKNDAENENAEKLILPEYVKELCKKQYPDLDDYRICLRGSRAAEDVGKLVDYMKTYTEVDEVLLLKPEPAAVSETNISHPDALCRTHTILQGSLCNRDLDVSISDTDETIGVCHEKNGDLLGMRSHCWFKANTVIE